MKLSRQFPLNALRVFEAVARRGSFTKAAEELAMTQTAVSYQIKILEDHLGNPVFSRRSRQIVLTETGQQLFPGVTEALGLLGDAVQSARSATDETLEIQSTPTFASHWLARHLGSFQLQHPTIAVRLVRQLGGDDPGPPPVDVAIHIASEPWEGLICHPILRLDYTPMLHPRLAESIGGIHEPADLLKLPWISDVKDMWTDWFDATGLDFKTVRHANLNTFGALDLQANAAIAGHGVAMLSPFFFRAELAAGRLIQPFDLCRGDGKTYWLVYPPSRRNSPKVRAFRTWIEAALQVDMLATEQSA